MPQPAYQTRCEQAARQCLLHGLAPPAIALLIAAVHWPIIAVASQVPLWLLVAAALLLLATSTHLIFDASLFRLMSRHPDEIAGGRAVDELLAGMRLQRRTSKVRTLSERLAGTRSIIVRQYAALALLVGLALFIVIGPA